MPKFNTCGGLCRRAAAFNVFALSGETTGDCFADVAMINPRTAGRKMLWDIRSWPRTAYAALRAAVSPGVNCWSGLLCAGL